MKVPPMTGRGYGCPSSTGEDGVVDKEDDDEDVQDTVWRIKEAAREAVERAHSAINDAWSEVQALIDENDESDEEGAVQDAVEELWTVVAGLEAAADEVERASAPSA